MKNSKRISLICVLAISKLVFSQVMLEEIALSNQIEKSSLVLEGKVISKKSFWNVAHKNIYTVNTVEVYKVFKGEALSIVEVITPGGTVGLEAQIVTPSLKLKKEDIGVFTLHDNYVIIDAENKSTNKKFKPYSSLQGFYKYDLSNNVAVNPYNTKQGISSTFYNEIQNYTKTEFIKISSFDVDEKFSEMKQNKSTVLISVTNFSPITINAGAKAILTIIGTNFGTVKGKVDFSNADNAGANFITALNSQVLSWTDTVITVEVPTEAGTGKIRIVHNDGSVLESTNTLTITHAQANIVSDNINAGIDIAYPTQLVDINDNGGYTWQMTTDFDTVSGAEESFTRAMEIWSCETKVNWILSSSAVGEEIADQHKPASDDINIIAFDDSTSANPDDDLPDSVLGRRTSYYSACYTVVNGETSMQWYIREFDIIFDDETNWNFESTLPNDTEYDFESVAVHELGHCRQLDHIINTDNVMHFAISKGENLRALNTNNIEAANIIQDRSTSSIACDQLLMLDYSGSCSLGVNEEELKNGINMYPNPAKNQFFIKNSSFLNLEKVVIYDISGRLISEHDISNASRTKTINIEDVSSGVYFVNIHSDITMITKKIVLN